MKSFFKILGKLLLAILIIALVTGGIILYAAQGSEGEFSYLVVLGTTVEGTAPSPMLKDRIDAAATYLTDHEDVICVVAGGKGDEKNLSEAKCMYNGLVAAGIDPSRILLEDKATTTAENFTHSLALLEDLTGSKPQTIGVLSSEFHLLRASFLAKDHGVTAVTIPANTSDSGTFVTYFLREIVMVWVDGIKCLF